MKINNVLAISWQFCTILYYSFGDRNHDRLLKRQKLVAWLVIRLVNANASWLDDWFRFGSDDA